MKNLIYEFLLYSPLNQGLKQDCGRNWNRHTIKFLLYSPLNQGLKPPTLESATRSLTVFTLQSIKSRIET